MDRDLLDSGALLQSCSWISLDNLPKGHPDRVGPQDYRTIYSFSAEDPRPLVAGG